MRRFRPSLLLMFFVALQATAQHAPASAGRAAVTQVSLGDSTTPLTGPWTFHTGDDMAWAQPEFDDSGWDTMDLTGPPGSFDQLLGSSGYLPGWTTRGYKGYSGYAWYRLRINVRDGQTRLALKMPDNFDDAYQVYVNGQRIYEFGRFTARGVTVYFTRPQAFPLPANLRSGPMTLAIRMWMDTSTPLMVPDAGGLHGPPVLGQASAIAGLLQLDWDAENRGNYSTFFQITILVLALLVALALFWLDPKEPAYFWLGLTCTTQLAIQTLPIVAIFTWISANPAVLFEDAVLNPANIGLWVLFWASWFQLGGMVRLHRAVWSLVVGLGIATAMLREPLYGTVIPVHAVVWMLPLTLVLKLLLGVMLVWVTIRGIRKNRAEGWLALPAILLVIVSRYSEELAVLHVPLAFYPFGIGIGVHTATTVLTLSIVTVLLVRRFLNGQHEREQLKQEIEQARQVQQVLIPEALPVVPGFTLESEYRPAQKVGGDFFQILAHPTDGSLLIVLGDVTGHGLQAAMLVSLLVGAIRMVAETEWEPLAILQGLNRRLLGRGHANATCFALRLTADGSITLANAGHLPPYLNGKEVEMEGALPLGVTESAMCSVMQFQMQPGDRLTLLTDGVMEAQSEKKELFGFARTQQISDQSASSIAETAQKFGQQDDITVLSVMRLGSAEPATVPMQRLATT